MRTASPTRSAVNTADSAPCFNPNPMRSATVKATTAPTTASVVVLAGPMMLARRLIATWSHAGEIIADGFRTERSSPFLIGPLDAEAQPSCIRLQDASAARIVRFAWGPLGAREWLICVHNEHLLSA